MDKIPKTLTLTLLSSFFPVVLLYKVVLVVLFTTLCKVVLTFEPLDGILKCDYSNDSYLAILSFGTVYYAVLRFIQF